MFDVAIVGGGPAGATCAAFCAGSGLRTLVLEREKFPREKVCGDCLNPNCWPILERLQLGDTLRAQTHCAIERVEFVVRDQAAAVVPANEIVMKRSLFDEKLLVRSRELGAEVHEETTIIDLRRDGCWQIQTSRGEQFSSRILVAADGRNSTVARLLKIFPRVARERVALQAHVPRPCDFENKIVLQFLPEGYSGQAPVNERQLNLCLVGQPTTISQLRAWATERFELPPDQTWRTITPLARPAITDWPNDLLLIGDAARVVEPFTGEGIFYALRSGDLAAEAIAQNRVGNFPTMLGEIYRGRLWVNRLARTAVTSPRAVPIFFSLAKMQPKILRALTAKVVGDTL